VRAGYDLTGDINQARRLAGQAAMWITERDTPEEAYEDIYTLNDGPREPARKAVLKLFETSLARA